MSETKNQVNPNRLDRQTLTALLNKAGQKNGWGQITSETTIQHMVGRGLPRILEGRTHYYSIVELAAFLMMRQKQKDSEGAGNEQELKARKLSEEIRKLEVRNDQLEGKLVDTAELAEQWALVATIFRTRLESIARQFGGDAAVRALARALDEASREIRKTLGEKPAKADPPKEKKPLKKGKVSNDCSSS